MNVLVAKRLLPNMPDELFRLYMEPMIAEYGWPFYSLSSPATQAWQQLFDCHDLRTISQLVWERREFTFSLEAFHRLSRQQITGLLDAHILGAKNFYATIPNTNARFHRARTYIADARRVPVAVVLMKDERTPIVDGLRILDGNHRLAAMASISNSTDCIVDSWIGSPPS